MKDDLCGGETGGTFRGRLPVRRCLASMVVFLLCQMSSLASGGEAAGRPESIPSEFRNQPQWLTGPRLLRMGESIEFRLFLPAGMEGGTLEVFARYLEQASPGTAFQPGGGLGWLGAQKPESLPLESHDGEAVVAYLPKSPGNYLARWRVGGETLYRYFSVVEDDWIVVNFATFFDLNPKPSLHDTGIPLDYHLPIDRLQAENPLYREMLHHQRFYGDLIVLEHGDMPDTTQAQRVEAFGGVREKARGLFPDGNDLRAIRVCANHEYDPGYVETFQALGVNDHCGLWEPDGAWWLGMPEFFYFSSPEDCRRINQGQGGSVVGHAWDFCAGFHFLGPTSWHYAAALGDWATAKACLTQGLEEARNLAELSGHPAFITPLYDGTAPFDYAGHVQFKKAAEGFPGRPSSVFAEEYLRFMAFEVPKKHKLVFGRTLDMADYFRRHYTVTLRTVFVSKTNHALYDGWWSGDRWHLGMTLRNRWLAWDMKPSRMRQLREALGKMSEALVRNKDKRAEELIVVEEQTRSIRFERECIFPIWWFDYAALTRTPKGSPAVECVEVPDLNVDRSEWVWEGRDLTMTLKIKGEREVKDLPVCLWGIPAKWEQDLSKIQTNAKEIIPVKNTDGEFHLVLFLDIKPETELRVRIVDASAVH